MNLIKLKLKRLYSDDFHTIGALYINKVFECFTLEDPFREEKIYGSTRIPAGEYCIKLRKFGGLHEKYSIKFSFHQGMLHLQEVPEFTNIYIHIGNTPVDTLGCILVGKYVGFRRIANSTDAYIDLYNKLLPYFNSDNSHVFIKIVDETK